ncbi:MAG: GspH/FimT family pseudopilin [Syntrophales bacterium]|jgi:type II secretion system protein H|nr:GspH/FimT family pseudopilin [Syntrophales bacterium]MCK9527500.1 GspH/FimT family pseudopilin [Syntrophales bacterium]MDX9922557.1 GspH/FimT family pseudopilin [Syntrophales bacterium]
MAIRSGTTNEQSGTGGFTLIELLIVIAIMGIIGGMVVFSWQQYVRNVNLKTAGGSLMADISLSRQRAVAEGVKYCMQFEEGSSTYTINTPSCDAPDPAVQRDLASIDSGLSVSTTTFNSDRIYFQPRGTVSPGTITVRNSRDSKATITINITGRSHVLYSTK